jgi:hypothetical protein
MQILVLHGLNQRARKIKSVIEHELMMTKLDSVNSYHIHNARVPMSHFQKRIQYDAIIITSTFLDLLTSRSFYKKTQSCFEFLSSSNAFKLAFPQDDYWLSEIRDEWFCKMNINIVFPVCQKEQWGFLYPKYSLTGRLMQGYTGYVHERHFELNRKKKRLKNRKMDVVYRATKMPLFPNRLGYQKGNLGTKFEKICKQSGSHLRIDVEGKPKTRNQWAKLVSDSRTVLGSPSGSSTLVNNWITAELLLGLTGLNESNVENELSAHLPSKLLGRDFTAISPRNIEAAATGTVQVLALGDYGHVLNPMIDYIPFDFRLESLPHLERQIKDFDLIERISSNCWKKIVSLPDLQAKNHVGNILKLICNARDVKALNEKLLSWSQLERYLSKMLSNLGQISISMVDSIRIVLLNFLHILKHGISK